MHFYYYMFFILSFILIKIPYNRAWALPSVADTRETQLIFETLKQKYNKIPDKFIYISLSKHRLYFYNSKFWSYFVNDVKMSDVFLDHTDTDSITLREKVISQNEMKDILISYPISKSKNPCSNEANSGGTPLGKHTVKEIISGSHPYVRFASKQEIGDAVMYHYVGECRGTIVGGIIALSGAEEACISTEERYIYIHGSFRVSDIGQQDFSNGCVLMEPADMCHLCHYAELGTVVFIDND